jgi:hypothetical protein
LNIEQQLMTMKNQCKSGLRLSFDSRDSRGSRRSSTSSSQWIFLFSALFLAGSLDYVPVVMSAPTTLKYDVVSRMKGAPVLGRGFSLTTNSLHSSCLDLDGVEEDQLYNYERKQL